MNDKKGRNVLLVRAIGGTKITMFNLYAPDAVSSDFFKNTASFLEYKANQIKWPDVNQDKYHRGISHLLQNVV